MESRSHPYPKIAGSLVVTVLLTVLLVAIGRPAISDAQDAPGLYFVHVNERLIDTRSGAKPADGWNTVVPIDLPYDAVQDWQINVQVVQADGAGWVEVDGQSAVVHDGGRSNVVTSVAGDGGGIDVRLHGGSAHVIIDVVRVVTANYPAAPTAGGGDGDGFTTP